MYKQAAIINNFQLSLLTASFKFQKNSKRIVSSIIFFTVQIYCPCSVGKLYLHLNGSCSFLVLSGHGFVLSIFRIFSLLWMEMSCDFKFSLAAES